MKDKKALYELQAKICSAMAHPIRLQILDLLSDGEKNSTEILKVLKVPKATLSQHVSVLRDANLIKVRKDGTCGYLSLAIPKIKDACAIVQTVLVEKIKVEEKRNLSLIKELKSKVGR
ncbi:MAG: winged helix-turn-helix transcriptional regulator [Bdellovibrionales bacterium]|nr:winged helix-turn-helix transcriptional regulator [Bdellovibrionales bacterium]